MTRKDWNRVALAFIAGLWFSNFLSAFAPEGFDGIWIASPFVAVFAAWNYPSWRDRVRLRRDIRDFQKGHSGNEQPVR